MAPEGGGRAEGRAAAELVAKTYDGFDIQPLYARAAGKPRAFRAAGDWAVTARVDHPEGAQANELALADLENGADGLHVVFAGSAGAYGFGLKDAAGLAPALKDVYLDAGLRIIFDLPGDNAALVAAIDLAAPAMTRKIDLSLGLDPLGAAALPGGAGLAEGRSALAALAKALHEKGSTGPCLRRRPRGPRRRRLPAQELAFALAAASMTFARWKPAAFRWNERAKRSTSASPPTPTNS